MQAVVRGILCALLAVICVAAQLLAADARIHGVVKDNTGKPVPGALVKASAGTKSVSRFTHKDGRYEIAVPAGKFDVTVDAYGFAPKRQDKDTTEADETNFILTPRVDLAHLTSAELQSMLPDNPETKFLRATCIACHSFGKIIVKRGYTSTDWQDFIPTMTRGRLPTPTLTDILAKPAKLAALGMTLEKYFGPEAPYFGPDADPIKLDQVKHADVSETVMKATIREYTIPTPYSFPHSITVDQQGDAWFAEIGPLANKIGRFGPLSETFQEYPLPITDTGPHTGAADARTFWVTLTFSGPEGDVNKTYAKVASVDRETGKVETYAFPGYEGHTHTLTLDQEGNVWCSGSTILKFDTKTRKFREYKLPVPAETPDNTMEAWQNVPGQPPAPGGGSVYDVQVDSKGNVWASVQALGLLVRIDPPTGETKIYYPPDTPSIKGLAVDEQDNIWFAGHQGNRLGKLDPKTGTFKLYQPPTPYATPYGLAFDKKTGYVWLADLNGNNVTRFDPKTEQFAEYPIPSSNASPRFIGVDSKGRVWFTEFMNGKIGVVEP